MLMPPSGFGGRKSVFLCLLSIFASLTLVYFLPLPSPASHFHFLAIWAAELTFPERKRASVLLVLASVTFSGKESREHR